MLQDILTTYKLGIKTLYYHNTRDGSTDAQVEKEPGITEPVETEIVQEEVPEHSHKEHSHRKSSSGESKYDVMDYIEDDPDDCGDSCKI